MIDIVLAGVSLVGYGDALQDFLFARPRRLLRLAQMFDLRLEHPDADPFVVMVRQSVGHRDRGVVLIVRSEAAELFDDGQGGAQVVFSEHHLHCQVIRDGLVLLAVPPLLRVLLEVILDVEVILEHVAELVGDDEGQLVVALDETHKTERNAQFKRGFLWIQMQKLEEPRPPDRDRRRPPGLPRRRRPRDIRHESIGNIRCIDADGQLIAFLAHPFPGKSFDDGPHARFYLFDFGIKMADGRIEQGSKSRALMISPLFELLPRRDVRSLPLVLRRDRNIRRRGGRRFQARGLVEVRIRIVLSGREIRLGSRPAGQRGVFQQALRGRRVPLGRRHLFGPWRAGVRSAW